MSLFVEKGGGVEDRGERIELGKDPDTGEHVYLWVRPLPPWLSSTLNVTSAKRTIAEMQREFERAKAAGLEPELSTDEARLIETEIVERVSYAIIDSEGFHVTIEDDGAAKFYSAQLGEEITAGQTVLLDGKWTKGIKARLLRRFEDITGRVLQELDRIKSERDERKKALTANL